ncbi:MAG: peptidoglycan editing factor PgeF [Tannerellaceae bacterium]|jgi:YfiH family protein|nr:peptidoglycan editing factor PgeF [Tannerellaceae bacterium]
MKTSDRNSALTMRRFSIFEEDGRVVHFITTRHGGVSTGNYASLNLSEYAGDDPAAVRRNRETLCGALGIPVARLCVPRQVHGDRIGLLEEPPSSFAEDMDALITGEPGICLAVSTADCVSLLLYAPDKKKIAAVHAGWRGTVLQIAGQTVRRMAEELGCNPGRMLAGIGPSIGCGAFEVGEEVCASFISAGLEMQHICRRNASTGKAHIDLKEANRLQLLEAGIPDARIEVSDVCTYTRHDEFFSARRLGILSGRMLTGIMLKNKQE